MADFCDLASEAERQFKDAALANAGAVSQEVQLVDQAGRVVCIECGEPIPSARLAAMPGAVRCVECQEEYEGNRDD